MNYYFSSESLHLLGLFPPQRINRDSPRGGETTQARRIASIVIVVTITLTLSGCGSGPDYTPIGDGLKALGICLVVYGLVHVLAEFVKLDAKGGDDKAAKPKRSRPAKKSKGGES